jgi:hypothetical protein
MAAVPIGSVHDDLVWLTVRLTEEFPHVPAGSVMRCASRVLWGVRLRGLPAAEVSDEVGRVARLLLARREAGLQPSGSPLRESIGWGRTTYRRAG